MVIGDYVIRTARDEIRVIPRGKDYIETTDIIMGVLKTVDGDASVVSIWHGQAGLTISELGLGYLKMRILYGLTISDK